MILNKLFMLRSLSYLINLHPTRSKHKLIIFKEEKAVEVDILIYNILQWRKLLIVVQNNQKNKLVLLTQLLFKKQLELVFQSIEGLLLSKVKSIERFCNISKCKYLLQLRIILKRVIKNQEQANQDRIQ
jgi:hypothetical protein